ncbi:MAG: hypothetical protein EBZ95_13990 [Chitinophagia bacterium]|nr:hypothetical protein [Chitinophagia bacterium]
MRVNVIHGDNAEGITHNTNKWLEDNESQKVIISISPVSACNHYLDGGYITIIYTDKEEFFEKIP